MSSESEQLKWKAGGLPGDALSIENAITILQSNAAARRAPFIIDPSTAATAWLEGQLSAAEGKAEVLPAGDARWSTQVELAVRFGKTLLIRDCDGVEAALYSVLRRDLYQIGGRNMVWVGDKQVDFNDSFALYMTTRNPAPQLPPDARALVNVVNFSVTRSGLEGQLLSATIQHERPELEARKSALLKEEEDLKMQLADLERDLVQNLATSTGNLLENTALIESLSATKSKSADIGTSLQGSARAAVELDQQRNTYRPFAEAGAQLYFLVQALTRANHMYQFSLAAFSRMFKQTLEAGVGGGSVQDAGAGDTAARIASLIPSLQNRALLTIGRSLLKGDRLMFALHVVHGTHGRCFGTNEWEFFVGELVPDVGAGVDPSFPSWAPPDRGALFTLLLRTFPSLARACNFDGSASEWKAWGASPNPEQRFPGAAAGVTGWQRVLLIQVLRPDRLVTALAGFVCDTLRLPSVDPPAMQWGDMYASESDKNTPILLITTTGADPTADLRDFAASAVGAAKYRELAMGGGQQAAAEAMVREAAEAGAWVCLKNVHLVVSWLPALEKLLSTHDEFPPILLQSSMKVTFESPPGLKKNLQRTLESWSPEYISGQAVLPRSHGGGGSTPPTTPVALLRSQLLFLMAWFHAVVQERRTYVPQGWTKGYEFSTADLRAGATLVDDLIASLPPDMDASSVPWAFFHGLMESAVYGCRVDNGYDARVMRVYLRRMFHPSVLSKAVGGGGRPLTGSALSHPLTLPDSTNAADYSRMVDGLPDLDVPAVFGLPPNIDRSVQRAIALRVTASLRSLSVAASSGGGFNRSAWKAALGPVIDLWGKIVPTDIMPTLQQAESAAERGGGEGVDPDPMGQFVFLEAARGARVVRRVSDDLNALKQVLFGVGLLTRRTQSVAEALLANALPGAWIRHWKDGPEDPRVWLRGTVERCHALATKWLPGLGRGGESSRLLASPVNLGHLFRPGTFLEAYRQVSARQLGTSMDGLALQSAMDAGQLKEVGAASSVAIEGLILQGAVWDGSRLAHADASTAEAVPMRPVYVTWLPPSAGEVYPPRTTVTTPVYTGLTRETFVTRLSLPIPADSTMTWIQAGVALLLGSD
ncbi:DYNC2H1 [Symbiodinium sp. KB8]|nr:DYNC2H1 [Symbiodinium sp. KB8]